MLGRKSLLASFLFVAGSAAWGVTVRGDHTIPGAARRFIAYYEVMSRTSNDMTFVERVTYSLLLSNSRQSSPPQIKRADRQGSALSLASE